MNMPQMHVTTAWSRTLGHDEICYSVAVSRAHGHYQRWQYCNTESRLLTVALDHGPTVPGRSFPQAVFLFKGGHITTSVDLSRHWPGVLLKISISGSHRCNTLKIAMFLSSLWLCIRYLNKEEISPFLIREERDRDVNGMTSGRPSVRMSRNLGGAVLVKPSASEAIMH